MSLYCSLSDFLSLLTQQIFRFCFLWKHRLLAILTTWKCRNTRGKEWIAWFMFCMGWKTFKIYFAILCKMIFFYSHILSFSFCRSLCCIYIHSPRKNFILKILQIPTMDACIWFCSDIMPPRSWLDGCHSSWVDMQVSFCCTNRVGRLWVWSASGVCTHLVNWGLACQSPCWVIGQGR